MKGTVCQQRAVCVASPLRKAAFLSRRDTTNHLAAVCLLENVLLQYYQIAGWTQSSDDGVITLDLARLSAALVFSWCFHCPFATNFTRPSALIRLGCSVARNSQTELGFVMANGERELLQHR